MICGPAIMTKASGRICAKLTAPASRCTYGETSPETGDGPPPRTGALTYSAGWDGLTERSRSSRARRFRIFRTRPGEGRQIDLGDGFSVTVKAGSAETAGSVSVLETEEPAGLGPPIHVHHD